MLKRSAVSVAESLSLTTEYRSGCHKTAIAAKSKLFAASLGNLLINSSDTSTAMPANDDRRVPDWDGNVRTARTTKTWVQTAMSRVLSVVRCTACDSDTPSDINGTTSAPPDKHCWLG